jgi:hypothetical protein
MLYILSALSASVLAYVWIEVLAVDQLLGIDAKPFSCRLCMSFWFGVFLSGFHGVEALLYVPTLAVLFERLMWRFEI